MLKISSKNASKNSSKNASKKSSKNSSKKETETYKKNQTKSFRIAKQQHKSRFLEALLVRQVDGKLKNTNLYQIHVADH